MTLPAIVFVNMLKVFSGIGVSSCGALIGFTLDIFESRVSVFGRAVTGIVARQTDREGKKGRNYVLRRGRWALLGKFRICRRRQGTFHLILVLGDHCLDFQFFFVIRLQGNELVARIKLPPLPKKIGLSQGLSPGPVNEDLGMVDRVGIRLRVGKVTVNGRMDPMDICRDRFSSALPEIWRHL